MHNKRIFLILKRSRLLFAYVCSKGRMPVFQKYLQYLSSQNKIRMRNEYMTVITDSIKEKSSKYNKI